MPKKSVTFLVLALICTASACPGTPDQTPRQGPNYQKVADETAWTWSDHEASLVYSLTQLQQHLQFEITSSKDGRADNRLTIKLIEDAKPLVAFKGHWGTVLTRWDDAIYIADFNPIATGCQVYSLDLKTGKELWRAWLQGIGLIGHSKYMNNVTIRTDGRAIIVHGNEAGGKYVEFLDKDTGKTIGHRIFEKSN